MSDSLSKIDRELEAEAESLQKSRYNWQMDREKLSPIIEGIVKLGGDTRWSGGSLTFTLVGNRESLLKAMRLLRKEGCKLTSERPKEGATSWSGLYELEGLRSRYVFILFSSNVCKRVQVGTKMVEMPVYEVVCEEGKDELPF